jgi:hypothetical protein
VNFTRTALIELGHQSKEAAYVASVMGEFNAFNGVGHFVACVVDGADDCNALHALA